MGIDDGLEELTLQNVGDGVLEQQFQERLEEARKIFADSARLEESSSGTQTVLIVCEVEIERNCKAKTYQHSGRALIKKRPAPLRIYRGLHSRSDGFKVKPEIQEPLPIESGSETLERRDH